MMLAKPLSATRGVVRNTPARPAARRPFQAVAKASSPKKASSVDHNVGQDVMLTAAGLFAPFFLFSSDALAKGGELGILEGRTAALVHPAVEFTLLATTLYAGYLGWQWRRTRTLGDEIRELKKQIPAPTEDNPTPSSPISTQVVALEQERKGLLAGNFKDKHFVAGSWLLAAGVGIAVEGCVNTYMRTGRLFPGPHLYAGAGIVVLWAMAAALVPAMQKGNDSARSLHIGLNAVNVALFLSQVPTGLEIVGKVFEFTSWP